jgi:hypothetical protein
MLIVIVCAVGILVCLAVMMVVMPLGMRLAHRLRGARTDPRQTEEPASGVDSVDDR